MNFLLIFVHCYFSRLLWVWSKESFENSSNALGWMLLVSSAANFAAAMTMVLS